MAAASDRARPRLAAAVLVFFVGYVLLRCVVVSLLWSGWPKLVYLAVGVALLGVLVPRIGTGRRSIYLLLVLLGFAGPFRLALGGRAEMAATIAEHGRLAYILTAADVALAVGLIVTAALAYRAAGRRPPGARRSG